MQPGKVRADDVLQVVHRDVTLALGSVGHLWGLNEVVGRLFGALYFSEEPLSLDELAHRLGVSPATVSLNLPVLEGLRTVKRVWKRGDRKRYYTAETDIAKIIGEMVRTVIREEVELLTRASGDAFETLDRLVEEAPPSLRPRILRDRSRIQALAEYAVVAQRLLEVVGAASDGSAETAPPALGLVEAAPAARLRRRARRAGEVLSTVTGGRGG